MENESSERKPKIEPENMTFYKLCDDVVRLHRKNSATSIILIAVYVFMMCMMFSIGRRVHRLENERDVRILPEPTEQRVCASDNTRKLTAYVKWHDGGVQKLSLKSYRKIGYGMLELETNNSSIEQNVRIITDTENTIIIERSKKDANHIEGLIDNRTDGSR